MSTQAKFTHELPTERVSRCPICNASVTGGSSNWMNYVCGARVSETPHGSWTLSLPCKADSSA